MKKALSFILAAALLVSALIVPMTVSVSAETPETVVSLDFSTADSTAFAAGETSTDANGNTFVPVKYYYPNATTTVTGVKTELVTLEDNSGVEHDLLKVTIPSYKSNSGIDVDIIPTDKNGKPFILEQGATYEISADYYIASVGSSNSGKDNNINFGSGVFAHLEVPSSNAKFDSVTSTWGNTALVKKAWLRTAAAYQYAEKTSGTATFMTRLYDGTVQSNFTKYTAANWYDKKTSIPAGRKEFTVSTLELNKNVFWVESVGTDSKGKKLKFGYENYLTIALNTICSDTETVLYFDNLTLVKTASAPTGTLISVNFDDHEGGFTATDVYTGEIPEITSGNFKAVKWYSDAEKQNEVTEITEDMAGKNLYADWELYKFNVFVEEDGGTRYYTAKNTYTIGFKKINNVLYYFDPYTGYLHTGLYDFKTINGKTFTVDLDDPNLTMAWDRTAGASNYAEHKILVNGTVITGWTAVGNVLRYFYKKTGNMAVGNTVIGGKLYGISNTGEVFNTPATGFSGDKYYKAGSLVKGWIDLGDDGKYYASKTNSGKLLKDGNYVIGGKLYSFNEDGKCTGLTESAFANSEDGMKYYNNGTLVKLWFNVGGYDYYARKKDGVILKDGIFTVGGIAYEFDADGRKIGIYTGFADDETGTKYYKDGKLVKCWFETEDGKYYAVKATGYILKDGEYTVGGVKYNFAADGKLITE